MKKYILNCYNLILVRHVAKKEDEDLFYMLDAPTYVGTIKEGDEFYAFDHWNKPERWMNVFSEEDCLLKQSVKKETNSWLRYLFWKIKYRGYNHGRSRRRR